MEVFDGDGNGEIPGSDERVTIDSVSELVLLPASEACQNVALLLYLQLELLQGKNAFDG